VKTYVSTKLTKSAVGNLEHVVRIDENRDGFRNVGLLTV
jgi:hypothetical protein